MVPRWFVLIAWAVMGLCMFIFGIGKGDYGAASIGALFVALAGLGLWLATKRKPEKLSTPSAVEHGKIIGCSVVMPMGVAHSRSSTIPWDQNEDHPRSQ